MSYQLDGPIGHADPRPNQVITWVSGVSIYRGVIVLWDEDRDARVQDVIDQLPHEVRRNVVAVGERKATLTFIVREPNLWPIDRYEHGFDVGGDWFGVNEVIAIAGDWNI